MVVFIFSSSSFLVPSSALQTSHQLFGSETGKIASAKHPPYHQQRAKLLCGLDQTHKQRATHRYRPQSAVPSYSKSANRLAYRMLAVSSSAPSPASFQLEPRFHPEPAPLTHGTRARSLDEIRPASPWRLIS